MESGLAHSEISINVADFALAAVVYWLVGFGLMFGPTAAGWVGTGAFGLAGQVEQQLRRERDIARVTLASIGNGVITTDESGAIQYLKPVAARSARSTSPSRSRAAVP